MAKKLLFTHLLKPPKFYVRAQKLGRYTVETDKDIMPIVVNGVLLNRAETKITMALGELKIRNIPQAKILGGGVLGGARTDWLLPDYRADLEYQGPFHGTIEGAARDQLRSIGIEAQGYRIVRLYERDLPRIKPRILELLGVIYG